MRGEWEGPTPPGFPFAGGRRRWHPAVTRGRDLTGRQIYVANGRSG
ncbi:uncharacterized protein Asalp_18110 [Aeromonas salmonicida subsp. pectinolytica 34mel]|uniref:Uncharacterized protein n=1 Tax=Aeromonas salmonicida subsp. pectinolytica 34mel TaxID=1324960 RepID=A0A2D1QFM3_AERSA|nr:uncharacterized protein Asalp_18110 [Aeromonas salmonicida subsp. pectinolytica 34mel]